MLKNSGMKKETGLCISFLFLALLITFSSFIKFTMKIVSLSELLLLFIFAKNMMQYGWKDSIIQSLCSSKRKLFVLVLFFIFVLSIALLKVKFGSYYQMIILFSCVSFFVFSGLVLTFLNAVVWKKELEKVMFSIVFAVGMAFMIVIPVGIVPDEGMHSFTAYRISNHFLGVKNEENMITMRESDGTRFLVSEAGTYNNENYNQYFVDMNECEVNPQLNSFTLPYVVGTDFLYVLPAIGIAIGRLLSFNAYQMYFLGRILDFALYIFGMYFIIKRTSTKKSLFLLMGLLPVFMQQGISISYDVPINLMLLYVISISMRLFSNQENSINKLEIAITVISCIALCEVKSHAYILVGLLPLLCLLAKKISFSKKKKLILILMLIFVCACFAGVFAGARFLPAVNLNPNDKYTVMYLLQNPKEIILIIYNTLLTFGSFHLDSFIGRYLGYLDIGIHPYLIYVYYLLLFIVSIPEEKEIVILPKYIKCVFVVVGILTGAFAFAGMLLANSTLQDQMVLGMQGRYLLASVVLILVTLDFNFLHLKNDYQIVVCCLLCFAEYLTICNLMLVL